ncbi:Arc family DNA-binding protein [Luteibacter sp. PPL201]|uniref:Arc family DNA-binding protein n=1 Tax=Luteibacter sahnii TaxID=3021977 RepID=A0ABT6B7W0_9GAMM
MARTDPQVNFRIPLDLNEKLKRAAAANNRSITAELVHRLEQSFKLPVLHADPAVVEWAMTDFVERQEKIHAEMSENEIADLQSIVFTDHGLRALREQLAETQAAAEESLATLLKSVEDIKRAVSAAERKRVPKRSSNSRKPSSSD